jgi:hypothetical protein
MSFAALLIHTCTIQRATRTEDAYHNVVEAWSDVATDVACRFTEKKRTLLINERAEKGFIVSSNLLVSGYVDLRERDQIKNIKLTDGSVVERTFTVQELLNRNARSLRHKSALLAEVN